MVKPCWRRNVCDGHLTFIYYRWIKRTIDIIILSPFDESQYIKTTVVYYTFSEMLCENMQMMHYLIKYALMCINVQHRHVSHVILGLSAIHLNGSRWDLSSEPVDEVIPSPAALWPLDLHHSQSRFNPLSQRGNPFSPRQCPWPPYIEDWSSTTSLD